MRRFVGPVLLDYPYLYELDGNKLYCNAHAPGRKDICCGGELDYDDGFNNLICTKCGREYHARDLQKKGKDKLIIVGGKKKMNVKVMLGKEVIVDSSKNKTAKVIDPEPVEVERPKVIKPEPNVEIPKAAIFNKIEEKNNDIEDISIVDNETESLSINTDVHDESNENSKEGEIEEMIDKENLNETEETVEEEENEEYFEDSYDDDDEEDYEQYLSNRERKQIRQTEKQNRRTDFGDF